MNCEAFRDKVFDLLDGSLADRAAFDAHRAACAGCADVLRGIGETERVLRAARVPTAPPELWGRIAAAVARPTPRFRLGPWIAAAAALLLAVFAVPARPAPRILPIRVVDASPEAARALGAFVPRYEGSDGVLAAGDFSPRND
jgi:hypothetical protein